jgi:hypothetical protein
MLDNGSRRVIHVCQADRIATPNSAGYQFGGIASLRDFARFASERYPRADVRGIASLALLDAVSVTPAVGLARELLGSPSVDFARCGEYGVERHRDTLDLDK